VPGASSTTVTESPRCGDQLGDPVGGHPADRDDRHRDRSGHRADPARAERPGQPGLRGRRPGRAHPEVVRALGHQGGRVDRVAGGAAQQVAGPGDPPGGRQRQVLGPQVGAVRADREGDVDPVVDQARRAGRRADPDHPAGEVVQDPVGAALGPDLHHRRTGGDRRGDDVQRRPPVPGVGQHVQRLQRAGPHRVARARRAEGRATTTVRTLATARLTRDADQPFAGSMPRSAWRAPHHAVQPAPGPAK
jgi:hypothetical protein